MQYIRFHRQINSTVNQPGKMQFELNGSKWKGGN